MQPQDYIEELLTRVKPEYVRRRVDLAPGWPSSDLISSDRRPSDEIGTRSGQGPAGRMAPSSILPIDLVVAPALRERVSGCATLVIQSDTRLEIAARELIQTRASRVQSVEV